MAFFQFVRDWAADNRYGNVDTADFIAAAERAYGQDLDAFFDVWLFQPGKPTSWVAVTGGAARSGGAPPALDTDCTKR